MNKLKLFNKKTKTEERAEVQFEDVLLRALIGKGHIDKDTVMNIPSLKSCINFISDTVSMIPFKLYKEFDGKVEEIKDDPRVRLLNDDTGDTLDAVQFWRAIITDYFLGKGGYAYINRKRNEFKSIHYVKEEQISVNPNTDPIFKDYDILVNGNTYQPFEFIKLLRNTRDGCQGKSIIEESPLILNVVYNTLKFEDNLVSKGGNKKGFLKSAKTLTQGVIDALRDAWKRLYSNNDENIVILNDGLEFQEASNSSVEMQLNENKETNSLEICKLFNIPETISKGTANYQDYTNGIKMAVMPVLKVIECALNRDFLLEKEKPTYYWAADTKEITKGDIETRYKAYSEAVKAGWISKNEIRYEEDREEIEGLDIVTMSLGEVIYDIKNKTYFTPNTKQLQGADMGGGDSVESGNQS